MAQLMSLSDWKSLTYGGALSRRSSLLQTVDAALEKYHRQPDERSLGAVRQALVAWVGDKGSDWRSSVRNGRGAVDRLMREVGLTGDAPGEATGAALAALRDAPQMIMKQLFEGAQVTWKNEFRGKLNRELAKPWSDNFAPKLAWRQYKASAATNKMGLASNTRGAVKAIQTLSGLEGPDIRRGGGDGDSGAVRNTVNQLIGQVVPPAFQREVLAQVLQLVPGFMTQFVAAVTPVAGTLSAAGGALYNAGSALYKHKGIVDTREHLAMSLAGDTVTQAVHAMVRILERERNNDIFAAGVSLTEFGGKLAGTLADGGTATTVAVGLAANIAKLLNIVRIVYRDVQEKDAANRLLLAGQLGPQTFEACPLLGCYIVCCLPTSALMTLIADIHGQPGWMNVAEKVAADHLQPLRDTARKTLAGHRFEVRKLARFPGVLAVNEKELERMKANVGRSGMVGFGSDSLPVAS